MSVAQVPRRLAAAKHRPIVLLSVLYEARVLFGVEKFVITGPAEVFHRATLHLDQLVHRFGLAGSREVEAGDVAVRLAVFAEMLEARVAVSGALRCLRVDALQIIDDRS